MLTSSVAKLSAWVKSPEFSNRNGRPGEVPGKTFFATPGFELEQRGPAEVRLYDGPLSHAFELRGVKSRRAVFPYQIWMLQRVLEQVELCDGEVLKGFLGQFQGGNDLQNLREPLKDCWLEKRDALLFISESKRKL